MTYAYGVICGAILVLGFTFLVDIWWPDLLTRRRQLVTAEDIDPITDGMTSIAWLLRLEHHKAAPEARELTERLLVVQQTLRGVSPKQTAKNLYEARS